MPRLATNASIFSDEISMRLHMTLIFVHGRHPEILADIEGIGTRLVGREKSLGKHDIATAICLDHPFRQCRCGRIGLECPNGNILNTGNDRGYDADAGPQFQYAVAGLDGFQDAAGLFRLIAAVGQRLPYDGRYLIGRKRQGYPCTSRISIFPKPFQNPVSSTERSRIDRECSTVSVRQPVLVFAVNDVSH